MLTRNRVDYILQPGIHQIGLLKFVNLFAVFWDEEALHSLFRKCAMPREENQELIIIIELFFSILLELIEDIAAIRILYDLCFKSIIFSKDLRNALSLIKRVP